MKISDISNNNISAMNIKGSSSDERRKKKKIKIIIITVLGVLLLLLAARLIYAFVMYNKYAKPFTSEDKVFLAYDEDGKLYESPGSEDIYGFYVGIGNFPYWNGGLLSAQIADKTIIDQDNKLEKELELNMTYDVMLDGTVTYFVDITDKQVTLRGNEVMIAPVKGARIYFTPELKYIEGDGTVETKGKSRDLTDSEVREYFEEHKDEIKDYLEKLWDYFGKENFKKQDKIVKLKDRRGK